MIKFKNKRLHAFRFNTQTLLLWSLILMMGSFFLRSHTTAFPLGLAEARMCWTCLFQETTLMSSTGWEKKNICKQMTLIFAYLTPQIRNHSMWNKRKQSSGDYDCNTLIDHINPSSKLCREEECPCHLNIFFSPCTHLCFCTWSHWTVKVVQIPDINLRIICSGSKEITLKRTKIC